MTNIAIFGSGIIKEGSRQFKIAYETGFLLAKSGFTVVNGGYGGSMLASAKGAKEGGGETVGVTTDNFGSTKNRFIDQEIRKQTWQERLHHLIALGDGYVILDGGTGTFAEFAVVLEMRNKEFHHKPMVVLGHHMQSVIRVLKRNPEISIPKDLFFAQTPKIAVQRFISHFHT